MHRSPFISQLLIQCQVSMDELYTDAELLKVVNAKPSAIDCKQMSWISRKCQFEKLEEIAIKDKDQCAIVVEDGLCYF